MIAGALTLGMTGLAGFAAVFAVDIFGLIPGLAISLVVSGVIGFVWQRLEDGLGEEDE